MLRSRMTVARQHDRAKPPVAQFPENGGGLWADVVAEQHASQRVPARYPDFRDTCFGQRGVRGGLYAAFAQEPFPPAHQAGFPPIACPQTLSRDGLESRELKGDQLLVLA